MFNFNSFLRDQFGNFDKTHKLLAAYGYVVDRMTVYQWFHRNAIPAKWMAVLLAIREQETGSYVIMARYLK